MRGPVPLALTLSLAVSTSLAQATLAAPAEGQPPPATPPPVASPTTPGTTAPGAAPPLPPVPQTTPENTEPGISPATPGLNLDAPPPETTLPPVPLVPEPGAETAPPAEPEGPVDERNVLILESADSATISGDRLVAAAGNVRLRYRGYRIRADRATFDDNRRIATFEGNVLLETGQLSVPSDFLSLNLRTREFSLRGGQTVVAPALVGPNLLQPLRLSGDTLTRVGRDLVATGGFLTTCDFPHPHFRIGFRKLTVIPNRRLALRDAGLYFGERRVLRLRYLSLPITERRLRYSYLPEVGRTEEEGFFVKTVLSYALSESLPGLLHVDAMQKKGLGLGFDQTYEFGKAAAGTLLLYSLRDQNRDVNNLNGRLSHRQQLGDVAATLNYDFQQNSYLALQPTSKTQNLTFNVGRNRGGVNTSASYSQISTNYGFGQNQTTSYTLSQGLRLGTFGDVNVRLNGSDYVTPNQPGRETQTGELNVRGRAGAFDLSLNANRNLAGSQGGQSYFSGTERVPEIIIGTDSTRLGIPFLRGVPLRLSAGYGKYIENPAGTETDRALFTLDADPKPIPLTRGGLSLQLGARLRQTVYGSDSAQYVLQSQSQLTQKLGAASSLNFTYGYLRPYGFSPLRFDQSGSLNNLGANLQVSTPRVRLTLFTGYDLQRARDDDFIGPRNPWQNLSLQLALRPSDAFQTRFTSSFDINSGRLQDLTNRTRVRLPGRLALDTGSRYDPRRGRLAQANFALETSLFGGAYNLSALAGYNGFTKKFEYRNFALTRSYHDYEITLTYIDQPFGFRSEKGFNFLIRLKAFPTFQRTGVGQYGTALDTGTGEVF